MVEKVGFTSCVFEKLCFTENTSFIVFSAKHSFSKGKMVCWKKNRNLWKIVGCFWTWQNGVFGVCFFWGFSVIVVCFWSFSGVASSCLFLGLEGLGVFVFLVFLVFVFGVCVAFVSVLFALFLFCCWIVFGVGSWFAFVFVFLFFFFLFFSFCFLFFFFSFCFLFLFFVVLFFLFCLRVRWGGPKGHLTWP